MLDKSLRSLLLLHVCLMGWSGQTAAQDTFVLAAPVARPNDLTQVSMDVEVGGQLKIVQKGQVKPLKMSVVGKLSYQEMILPANSASPEVAGLPSSARYYDKAEAAIKIENGGAKPVLRESRRLVGAQWRETGAVLFSPNGPFTREELDLIDLPASTLLLDMLLPSDPIAISGAWTHSEAAIGAILGLDAVKETTVESTLKEVAAGMAKVELAGNVKGAIQGVSTEIELQGKYHFDQQQQRITYFALLINEQRSVGHVAAGIDAVTKLQIKISPLASSKELNAEAIAKFTPEARSTADLLCFESRTAGFALTYDRRWHAVDETTKLISLRFVDRGNLVAQCNISSLNKAEPGKPMTLKKFQTEVQDSLKANFGQFIQASESVDDQERVIYRVVATGKVAELPIEWHYFLVADTEGNQVAFAFTMEADLVERFGQQDRALVAALEILPVTPATTASQSSKAVAR